MITIFLQIADLLINGAAYILSVLLGTSTTKSIFTNFNFFTKVNSADNPFLNVVMQDMIGSTIGAQFGAFLYKIAFVLFGLLVAVQVFKSFINPASRGNASPMRTILWILLGAFLMIYGQDITESILEWFTKLIQDNMAGMFDGLSTLAEDTNVISLLGFSEIESLAHLNRLGAVLACSFGVGGTLMRATITYLERYISFAVTAYLGPFAMAMTACDDTRQSTLKWIQSMLGQILGIILSILFLYMGAQMLLASDTFVGSSDVYGSATLNRAIIRCVGATVFFILSSGCEKFLSVFGIQTMHFGDAAQAVAHGAGTALMAVRTGFSIGSKVASDGPVGTGVAARSGLLNRLKTSPETVAQGGVKGAAAHAWNAKMDTLTQKHGGVTGTGGIKRTADGKLAFVSPEGATSQQRKILDNLNNGKIQNAIANGGLKKDALQKDANGKPVNEAAFNAAKALNSYGVNDANDIARAMFGDKAFKNGENYQMATLAKGDKTGGDYLVLSGVDQNGNLAAKTTRLPGSPESRLSEPVLSALSSEPKKYSDTERAELGTRAQDSTEHALMDNGFKDGYKGLAHSMLSPTEADKYAHIDSAHIGDDGQLKFTGTDKDGAKITSAVGVAGSDAVATDGERLMNSKNQPIASIDSKGNVEAYGYTSDGINVSDIPIKSTYTPPEPEQPVKPQTTPFASISKTSEGDPNYLTPNMGCDIFALRDNPRKSGEFLEGYHEDGRTHTIKGYANTSSTPFGDEHDNSFVDVSISEDKLNALNSESWKADGGYHRRDIGSVTNRATGEVQPLYASCVSDNADGTQKIQFWCYTDPNNKNTVVPLHPVTQDEYNSLVQADEEAHASKREASHRKKSEPDKHSKQDSSDDEE